MQEPWPEIERWGQEGVEIIREHHVSMMYEPQQDARLTEMRPELLDTMRPRCSVERNGFVDKFSGDGIMALFGALIAHEDHAQRACYAALHLKDALRGYAQEVKRTQGLTVSVNMGLNSGEVVVGKIGDDLRMEYTAQGHTVGMAARMLARAESVARELG